MIEEVKLEAGRVSSANKYRVPSKKWYSWGLTARIVFNTVYQQMRDNQFAFLHPKAEKPSVRHWRTTAWNAAWTAADAI